ncbi:unnamed protein product [Soboliphyme baturini]|uniref:CHDNT domain-containing protein n=1 Tax=Soboliphyme baturini TaxID=241478 RepID=A0A183J2D0_9BILA|nr:unnamed protein product [Soboliphyme baturini]
MMFQQKSGLNCFHDADYETFEEQDNDDDHESPCPSPTVSRDDVGRKLSKNRGGSSSSSGGQLKRPRRTRRKVVADDSSDTVSSPASTTSKQKMCSATLCAEFGLNDVVLDYDSNDFNGITNYKAFNTKVRPLLLEVNPKISKTRLVTVMALKWKEFQETFGARSRSSQLLATSTNGADTSRTPVPGSGGPGPGTAPRSSSDKEAREKIVAPIKIKLSTRPTGRKRKKDANASSLSDCRLTTKDLSAVAAVRKVHVGHSTSLSLNAKVMLCVLQEEETRNHDSDAEFEALLAEHELEADQVAVEKKGTMWYV